MWGNLGVAGKVLGRRTALQGHEQGTPTHSQGVRVVSTPGQRAHLPLHIPSYSIVGKYPGGGITGYFHPRFYAKMPGGSPWEEPRLQCKPATSKAFRGHHPEPWPPGPQGPLCGTHRAPPNPDVHCSACAAACLGPEPASPVPEGNTLGPQSGVSALGLPPRAGLAPQQRTQHCAEPACLPPSLSPHLPLPQPRICNVRVISLR